MKMFSARSLCTQTLLWQTFNLVFHHYNHYWFFDASLFWQ